MEFYRTLRHKLAEELEDENCSGEDVDSLKAENDELKQRLSDNYAIYVRKLGMYFLYKIIIITGKLTIFVTLLERRKLRIKELEERLKDALESNESLQQASQTAESKYGECKDQLDQLEGFQNQELGKVKHMLLTAETALAKEKERNCVQTDFQTDSNAEDSIISAEQLVQLCRQRDDLQERQTYLENTISKITTERDTMQASLLEIEIAKHDGDNANSQAIQNKDLRICALEATIETLNVTLNVRDSDIKTKKDELSKMKATSEETLEELRTKELKISALESEIERINAILQRRLIEIRDCQRSKDDLSVEVEKGQSLVQDLQDQLQVAERLNTALQNDCKELTNQINVLKETSTESVKSVEILHEKNLRLQEENEKLNEDIVTERQECQLLSTKLTNTLKEKDDLEKSIPGLVETSELVRHLKTTVDDLEDSLEEKNQAVRHLQLRANEMKKMLQKEMKSNGIVAGPPPPLPGSSSPSISPSPNSVGCDQVSSSVTDSHPVSDVTLRYLKNVIFKFLTSPETEAKQMTRALATLLDFSQEEEKTLSEFLEWKVSWFAFGAKPKLMLDIPSSQTMK